MSDINFRPYCNADYPACTDIFDANCPEFFSPNERQDYECFLEDVPEGYEVCEVDGCVLGAFGLVGDGNDVMILNWILLDPHRQGIGIGSKIMERVLHVGRTSKIKMVRIAASHRSAAFFARFGATTTSSTKDGWGPGMDRVDMRLAL
jgi:GNAT superfamily N-acetyltransferase